jgi:hypothetical protein
MYEKTPSKRLPLSRHLHGSKIETSLGVNELKRNDDYEFNNIELTSYMELGGTMYHFRCRDSYTYANGRVELLNIYKRLMNFSSLTNRSTICLAQY